MSSKIDIPLVIFAGGKSSRMGSDKSLLNFGGYDTLCEYQLKRFENHFENIYISTKDSNKFNFEANFIIDTNQDIYSPLIGIKSIFEYLNKPSFIAISVDTPFIKIETIKKLIEKNSLDTIATVSKTEYLEPLNAIYNQSILPIIDDCIQKNLHKLNFILKNANIVEFDNQEEFMNLNFKDDYLKALKIIY